MTEHVRHILLGAGIPLTAVLQALIALMRPSLRRPGIVVADTINEFEQLDAAVKDRQAVIDDINQPAGP